jgi:hypothetical protein
MLVRRSLWLLVPLAAFVLAGCPKKDDEEEEEPAKTTKTTAEPAPAPTPAPTTAVTLEPAITQPGISLRVKQELDNREDGIAGSPFTATGARGSVQSPTGWTGSKSGDVNLAASGDSKAKLAAVGGGIDKLEAAATALGLSGCQWNSGENATVGKGKLAASVADGTCKQGTTNVATAYAAFGGENLLVVGMWTPDGDANSVFGSMRSAAKVTGGGDSTGIGACCNALRQNAKSAPPQQQGMYMMAAGACDALRNNPQGRAALGQIRGMLAGASVPATCK